MSTASRILLAYLLVVAAAFYLLMMWLTDRVERQYLEAAEVPMVDAANILASIVEQELDAPDRESVLREAFKGAKSRTFEARIYNVLKRDVDMNFYVTDDKGVVLFDSNDGKLEGTDLSRYHDVMRTLNGRYGARSTRTDPDDKVTSIMYVGAPVYRDGEIVGVASVSKPQAAMLEFMEESKEKIRLYGWGILAVIMLAAVIISHWFSGPIRKLTNYARAVRRGERVSMPVVKSPDARTLSRALEDMRDALEDRKYVHSYVQTLTHEMKSPVAAIRGASELLEEADVPEAQRTRFLNNIRTETERLQNIIDRLLALSAIESMKSLENPRSIDLPKLVDEVCDVHLHTFEARNITLQRDLDGPRTLRGEAFLLEMALGNLLQNALEFSPDGGTVTIRVRHDQEHRAVTISVEDDGPGVPDYAIERVFDRFYSLQHPTTGKKSSGLGLCFVQEAAKLHGGSAQLENRTPTGARATLRLPV